MNISYQFVKEGQYERPRHISKRKFPRERTHSNGKSSIPTLRTHADIESKAFGGKKDSK